MGSETVIRITLLCEDHQMHTFACRFLYRRNFRARQVISLPCPQRGSGEQRVRKHFPTALRAVRGRKHAFLVVMIDADSGSTKNRRDQLARECRQQGVAVPTEEDRVLVAVPRRNIETWFAYLAGRDVDETTRYPRLPRENDCKPLADALYDMCHVAQQLREPAPPSLLETCRVYPRLKR